MDRLKILVVDDESRMRKLVRDFLVKSNYDVLEAGDGTEALEIFFHEKEIALVVLDVMMPKMDGWQVCREIRKKSDCPIIMITAKGETFDKVLGLSLDKPEPLKEENAAPVEIPAEVAALAEERRLAREAKNWAKSDELRDKIAALGFKVIDTKEGAKIEKL